MTTSTAPRQSVRAALRALIDYAGLFPPAELSLAQAQSEYEEARAGPHAWMLGRFILPARLLAPSVREPLSVIVDPDVDALNGIAAVRSRGVTIEALEIPLRKSAPFRTSLSRDEIFDIIGALEADLVVSGLRDIPAFVEIPRDEPWRAMRAEVMNELARTELGAKIRCGGVTAEAFPSVEEVAHFIATAHCAGVPFKATAGLHHPVRHTDAASGFIMHGFFNVLAASALAPRLDALGLQQVVAEEDPSAFSFDDTSLRWRDQSINIAQLDDCRRTGFIAYGSCSFMEPVNDLSALGLLPAQ